MSGWRDRKIDGGRKIAKWMKEGREERRGGRKGVRGRGNNGVGNKYEQVQ